MKGKKSVLRFDDTICAKDAPKTIFMSCNRRHNLWHICYKSIFDCHIAMISKRLLCEAASCLDYLFCTSINGDFLRQLISIEWNKMQACKCAWLILCVFTENFTLFVRCNCWRSLWTKKKAAAAVTIAHWKASIAHINNTHSPVIFRLSAECQRTHFSTMIILNEAYHFSSALDAYHLLSFNLV